MAIVFVEGLDHANATPVISYTGGLTEDNIVDTSHQVVGNGCVKVIKFPNEISGSVRLDIPASPGYYFLEKGRLGFFLDMGSSYWWGDDYGFIFTEGIVSESTSERIKVSLWNNTSYILVQFIDAEGTTTEVRGTVTMSLMMGIMHWIEISWNQLTYECTIWIENDEIPIEYNSMGPAVLLGNADPYYYSLSVNALSLNPYERYVFVDNIIQKPNPDISLWSERLRTEYATVHLLESDPFDNATEVPVNKICTLTFDFDIDDTTTEANIFIIDSLSNPVSIDIEVSSSIITVTPLDDLLNLENYIIMVASGLRSVEGYILEQQYNINFKTQSGEETKMLWVPEESWPDSDYFVNFPISDVIWLTFDYDIDDTTLLDNVELLLDGEVVPSNIYIYGIVYSDPDFLNEIDIEPTDPLLFGSDYIIHVKTGLKSVEGYPVDQEYNIHFSTPDYMTMLSSVPEDLAEDVLLDSDIVLTFDMEVDPDHLDEYSGSIEVNRVGGSQLICEYIVDGNDLIVRPYGDFQGSSEYTVTVYPWTDDNHDGLISINGNPLDREYTFSFSTIMVMSVVSNDPVENDYGQVIPVDKVLTITYSKDIDPSSVIPQPAEGSNVFLSDNGIDIHGYIGDLPFTVDVTDKVLSIIPDDDFIPGNFYTYGTGYGIASLDAQISDSEVYTKFRVPSTSFMTLTSTVPESGTVTDFSILGADSVVATFDKDVYSGSVYDGSIRLSCDVNPDVYTSISVDGDEITITPSEILEGDTEYTLWFNSPSGVVYGLYSVDGESLDDTYSMTFITESESNYMWNTDTNPYNYQTNRPRSIHPTITFDLNVDASTVTYGSSGTVNLKRGSTNIAGTVSVTDNVITITPNSNLNSNSYHTFTVSTAVKSVTGKFLAEEVYITFRTGSSI
jgi:hypothetical protein